MVDTRHHTLAQTHRRHNRKSKLNRPDGPWVAIFWFFQKSTSLAALNKMKKQNPTDLCTHGALNLQERCKDRAPKFQFAETVSPCLSSALHIAMVVGESIPRQADEKSGGPQGEKGLEFSRKREGQTFFPLYIP